MAELIKHVGSTQHEAVRVCGTHAKITSICAHLSLLGCSQMERLDLPEAIVFMQHYVARGAVAADALPDAAAVLAAHIQTDGNPNELRRFAPLLALNF